MISQNSWGYTSGVAMPQDVSDALDYFIANAGVDENGNQTGPMKGGMLVTNPIPEEYSMDHKVIDAAIEQALADAKAQGIHGKETTPFLLARVKDLTGGNSLESNIQLVYNNARLAAKTACALQTLEQA